jgi:hypothetical protein
MLFSPAREQMTSHQDTACNTFKCTSAASIPRPQAALQNIQPEALPTCVQFSWQLYRDADLGLLRHAQIAAAGELHRRHMHRVIQPPANAALCTGTRPSCTFLQVAVRAARCLGALTQVHSKQCTCWRTSSRQTVGRGDSVSGEGPTVGGRHPEAQRLQHHGLQRLAAGSRTIGSVAAGGRRQWVRLLLLLLPLLPRWRACCRGAAAPLAGAQQQGGCDARAAQVALRLRRRLTPNRAVLGQATAQLRGGVWG